MVDQPRRPGAVMAAAVILFIFGGLSLVGGLFSTASTAYSLAAGPAPKGEKVDPNDFFAVQKLAGAEVPSYVPTELAVSILGILLGAVKIFAGMGLLTLKPSARTLAIWAALCSIVIDIAHNVYSMIFLLPVADRLFEEQAQNLPPGVDFAGIMKVVMFGAVIVGMVFSIIIWSIVISLLSTQRVRDAFAGKFPEPEPAPVDERIRRYDGYDDADVRLPPPLPKSPGDTGIQ